MAEKMKGLSLATLVMAVVFTGVLSAGCVDDEAKGDIEYTDPTGNVVVLEGTPERVVTLTPALTDTVIELGAEDLLVGADNLSVQEHRDLGLTGVLSYSSFDLEKLVEMDPDLVIMDKTLDITEDNFNQMRNMNIPVYRVYPDGFDSVLELITDIGSILERDQRADEIVDDMMERRDVILENVENIAENLRPDVLFVYFYDGEFDPYVSTSSTFVGDLIEMAGGRNAVDDDTGVSVQVSVETIIDLDPDIIITSSTSGSSARSMILSKDTWKDIEAVKNGDVHDIEGDLIDRTGPGLIDGLEAIYGVLYTEE